MHTSQRTRLITALVLVLLTLAILLLCGCTTTVTPLCRHIVLAQHAAAADAGYEAETWRIKNPVGSQWKYHAATRIRKPGDVKWEWITQPPVVWTTGPQPRGVLLHRMQ